jgi:glycopeptide antibiotics resistance protein
MQMNIFLFIPFGLSTPFALPERLRHKVLLTVPAGMVISACVEACQYFFSLGHCETDDVIMNTIGAFAGATAFLIYTAIKKLINKRRSNKWKHIRKS